MSKPLISVTVAADRLKVSVQTVRSYIRDGILPATRGVKTFRIDPDHLESIQRPVRGIRAKHNGEVDK